MVLWRKRYGDQAPWLTDPRPKQKPSVDPESFEMRAILLANVMASALVSFAFAQAGLPPNTIDCAAFTHLPDGTWYVANTTTFDIASMRGLKLTKQQIEPHAMNIDGVDLYGVINRKCGGTKS